MEINNPFLNTLLAMLLAALIGLRSEIERRGRQVDGKEEILGGLRTHALLALLGSISGAFLINDMQPFSIVLSGTIVGMILLYYSSGVFIKRACGITEELSALFAYFIGVLCMTQPFSLKLTVALTIIVVFIVTRKSLFHGLGKKVSEKEVMEFTLFAIITLVVLPFLPKHAYTLSELGAENILRAFEMPDIDTLLSIELINPFKTWFMVVLVSGIDVAGYLLTKFMPGDKSALFSAAVGGFVSSTSTTVSLAIRSKLQKGIGAVNNLVAAALAANGTSFIQIFILVAPISPIFFREIAVPTLVLTVGCFAVALLLNKQSVELADGHENPGRRGPAFDEHIFSLVPALKFAALLTAIKLLTKIALVLLGSSAFVVASMLTAFSGVDAIMINISEMVNYSQIGLKLAFLTYMGVNGVNLASKTFFSFSSGDRKFARKFGFYIFIVFLAALAAGFLV